MIPLLAVIVCVSTANNVGYKFSIWSTIASYTACLVKVGETLIISPAACATLVVPLAPLVTVISLLTVLSAVVYINSLLISITVPAPNASSSSLENKLSSYASVVAVELIPPVK